ncbi:tRNA dimethylallyltransferase [Geodia barretti]|uniref:tRNA dimethylallyltransferase n=1 Tax=Geodia barretti TaxID=519541 RepID=A0AA35TKI6_GEOBA|nr:tRNA dimethylallyltransferase [Geodia barretti]
MSERQPLVAVIGATATGKTALAISLAQQFGGEIINADSRQVYSGMDIGTAKPTAGERAAAVHHLIDIRRPDLPLSLGEWLPMAREAIAEISSRGRLPILCGGTGQYVWALLEGWRVPAVPPDMELRANLEKRAEASGASALWQELAAADPERAAQINPRNVRRVIRALELQRNARSARAETPPYRALTIGLASERAMLYEKIDARVDRMMADGLLDEARYLARCGFVLGQGPLSGVGYSQLGQFLDGELTLPEAVARIKTRTHALVRRQNTWFKSGDVRITWLDATGRLPTAEARARVHRFLGSTTPCGTIGPDLQDGIPAG